MNLPPNINNQTAHTYLKCNVLDPVLIEPMLTCFGGCNHVHPKYVQAHDSPSMQLVSCHANNQLVGVSMGWPRAWRKREF